MTPDAHDLERIELLAMEDLYRGAPGSRAIAARVGGALVLGCPGGSPRLFNRVVGVGLERPATDADLGAVEAASAGHGLPWVLALAPGARPGDLDGRLRARGFAPGYGWMKFVRDPRDPPAASTALAVRRVGPGDRDRFAAIVAAVFGLVGDAARLAAALPRRPGWSCFVALDGERAVAAGALFVADRLGWLGLAGTLPEARNRGAQAALLRARTAAAADAGARAVVVETGERVPGRPDASYRNLLRAGFREAYVRPNWSCPGFERLERAAAAVQ